MYKSIAYKGKPMIVVKPIDAPDFDTLEELSVLIDQQDRPETIITQAAWDKYEGLVEPPDGA